MSKEKQIEEMEMAEMLEIIENARETYANDVTDHTENEYIREGLLNARYRKQSEPFSRGHEKGSEWISVEERLPSKSGKYICCTTKGTILIGRFYQLDDGGWFSNHNFCTVTHWMPLPEAPKMRKEDEGK